MGVYEIDTVRLERLAPRSVLETYVPSQFRGSSVTILFTTSSVDCDENSLLTLADACFTRFCHEIECHSLSVEIT